MKPYNLYQRAEFYNRAYHKQPPLVVQPFADRDFLYGFWFIGGGNVSSFYGSYQVGYLERIHCLFPDVKGGDKVVHLFSGSLPASGEYTRVGKDFTGKYTSDLEIDIEQLSSHLPFKPELILADPPYSEEDANHYGTALVNRQKVLSECYNVLVPGGFLVWMDVCLPLFSNNEFSWVGEISYLRSTGNRFRNVTIFQRKK